ncbi:unnamed protein product [Ambrosiozyma monospora]|uniref:Unnamed protein product n=1 Tax=Ambrosiozyma monospora TaxID=43982 RepID=A0ACB5UA78_AMBMO|nr:unnamed protein product [Ambrosiozyma monospora]
MFLAEPENTELDELEDWLISVSKDKLIKLWDLKARQCVETHVAHSGECWALSLNTSKELCFTTGMENQLKVWSIDLNNEENRIIELGTYEKKSKARGSNIEFKNTSQGEFFFVSNADKTVELFRLRTDKELAKVITKRTARLKKDKGMSDEEIEQSLKESKVNIKQ